MEDEDHNVDDILNDDDMISYYEPEWDDCGAYNTADGAFNPEAPESCWDNSI